MDHTPLPPGLPGALAERLRATTDAEEARLIEQRRAFHANPELGWQEIETTATIVADLTAAGYEVVSGPAFLGDVERLGMSATPIPGEGDTGCMAIYDTGRPGPTICMRVDI